ncbi:MAG TPA: NAD(P)H-dependent glycerol-3-phosphate dehydrogenase [Burkholderiales bacterium]|nr:NAD(P)H-dependent glycerol-3-phosphate dehydrogenase [Burkholderiales bacterium]
MKLAMLGAGAWGTALAVTLSARHEVRLWMRDPAQCKAMHASRANQRYLPGILLPDALELTSDWRAALTGSGVAIIAVTVAGLRDTLRKVAAVQPPPPVIWLCKGFEVGSSKLPHQVAAEELRDEVPRAALSGPSFAQEVARGIPAAVTLAASEAPFATRMARELHSSRLRIYSSDDLIGVEVGGAVKNVIAIAAGISDGLGFGESARAALVTRGLAEMTRLGLRLGGRQETFMGLSGAGDLILTCTGRLSRNRQVGLRLAAGQSLPDILQELGHVAEGVHSAREVLRLARTVSADMPIVSAVCDVLDEQLTPEAAVDKLLSRDPKPEHRI